MAVLEIQHEHLTPEDVDDFVNTDSEEVCKRMFFHLLSLCPQCHAAGGYVLEAYLAGHVELDFDSFSVDLAQSRAEAPGLWKELEGLDLHHQKERVQEDERLWGWGLAELLCERSAQTAGHDPAAAVQIAELAVEVSLKVRNGCDDDLWVSLLHSFAWAHLADAQRIAGDCRKAWRALSKAKEIWDPAFANAGDVLGYEARFVALTEGTEPDNESSREGTAGAVPESRGGSAR
jgi:hypothetical protein